MDLDRYDDFPVPRHSPRPYADVGSIPHAIPTSSALRHKPTQAQRIRIARDIAIYMAVEGGMSLRTAGRAFELTQEGIRKVYLRMACRKSRV